MPVAQVGAFVYLEPLVTLVVTADVLGEVIRLVTLIGGAVILLVGVYGKEELGLGRGLPNGPRKRWQDLSRRAAETITCPPAQRGRVGVDLNHAPASLQSYLGQ